MPALFAATLFVSALLLFMVQPMVGKMILPLLGGSPAAWNTCMVFFQALLLLGYLYAHGLSTRFDTRSQTRLHLIVLAGAVVWLAGSAVVSPAHSPVAVFRSLAPEGDANPVLGVLGLLAVAIGLPFLVISTSAPLLQRWFADTNHPSARDPYFLYAASNAGSLISLLGYPIVIEPTLTLVQQAWLWTVGYAVLLGMVYACGRAANRPLPAPPGRAALPPATPPTWPRRLRWLALAFVPSSLMLGVTFHMTTDIASVPLLWVIPLALYLVTFIVAFARTPAWFRPGVASIAPVAALLLVFTLVTNVMVDRPFYALVMHLAVFFVVALLMHTELAFLRPDPAYLTEYFLWISVGGVLGGIFNALVAPAVFPADYEYPVTLAASCFLIPVIRPPAKSWLPLPPAFLDVLAPLAVAGLIGYTTGRMADASWFADAATETAEAAERGLTFAGLSTPVPVRMVQLFVVYAVPCMLCFLAIDRPVRFGLCVTAILAVCLSREARVENLLWTARTPFGILKVARVVPANADAPHHRLMHGTTTHGMQAADPDPLPHYWANPLAGTDPLTALTLAGAVNGYDPRREPLTYYHRTGPVGWLTRRAKQLAPHGHTGMVGLGTGSVAAYAAKGDTLTFYEIDRVVADLIDRGDTFTYVNDARRRGADVRVVLGDARLQLEKSTDAYDLLLIDAFSSDAIPVHLLTREAIELYKLRLAPRGVLGLHISNRYINLEPVVARLAADAGLVARVFRDDDESSPGKTPSSWVALARTTDDLGDALTGDDADTLFGAVAGPVAYWGHNLWRPLPVDANVAAWTDDYADVLRVMQIKEIRAVRRFFGLPLPAGARE